MKIVTANLLKSSDSILLFTANSTINRQGRLVMGRGAAKDFKVHYSKKGYELDLLFGAKIKQLEKPYGCIIEDIGGQKIGAFQVKDKYYNKADLKLIEYSFDFLEIYIYSHSVVSHQKLTVSMNYPGIGNGGLTEEEVFPLIPQVDWLTVYKKPIKLPPTLAT